MTRAAIVTFLVAFAATDDDARVRAFDLVASGLAARLRIWICLPEIRRRLDEQPAMS